MLGRSRSHPSRPGPAGASPQKLDVLNAVTFRNRRVLRAMYGLPWEQFDTPASPLTVPRAREQVQILEALELVGSERVLDIGTGAGYRAALLGSLAASVKS